MASSLDYSLPTRIIFSQGASMRIGDSLKDKKVLLVTTSGFLSRQGAAVIEPMKKQIVFTIEDVMPNPDIIHLMKQYKDAAGFDYDMILAIGGGSVLDTAKVLSLQSGLKVFDDVLRVIKDGAQVDFPLIPVVAVPTTAGTGSEITPWATVWDMRARRKYSLHVPELFPKLAIYDPCLTLTVPKDLTVQTGLDTLSHALESIWNVNASEITRLFAVKSATLVCDVLVRLIENLNDIELREQMMLACMYAGMAFSQTQTSVAHAMSYYVTANRGVPHGIACSFTLPMLIDKVGGRSEKCDSALIEIFGELSSTPLREMFGKLGVATDYECYDVRLDDIIQSLENNQRFSNGIINLSDIC